MCPRSHLACLLLLVPCLCRGSLPGMPLLRNYDKYTYHGGTQNWEIAQAAGGLLLVANNEGLLTFDGVSWDKYPLPNRSIVRSLKVAPGERIYVGGQDELGYFQPDASGLLHYHSLMHLLPQELLPIADVWDILLADDRVLFRTSRHLFGYRGDRMELLVTDRLEILGGGNGRVLLQSATQGLVEWTPEGVQAYPGGERFRDVLITDIRPGPQGALMLCTLREGLFLAADGQIRPWAPEAADQIRALRPQAACTLSGGQVAVATELGGLLLLDAAGRLMLNIDRGRGLQNNYITSLFEDWGGNLWMGLNNGLSMAEIAAPYRYVIPDGPLMGTAYAALQASGSLYLGTSNGLYLLPGGAAAARLVPGTESQVWGLHRIGGQVLLAHHEGSFRVDEGIARPSSPATVQGVWLHLPLRSRPGYVIAGHYGGLALYRQSPAGLEFLRRLEGFSESCRFLVEDRDGQLWASHPYRGMFRIRLSDSLNRVSVQRYGPEQGLPSSLYNHVFFVQGEVIVAGERGLFRLNPASDRYEPHPDYAAIFSPEERIIRLTEDARGHIWFATDRHAGVIRIEDQGLQRHSEVRYYPRISGKLVNGFELICPVSDSLVIAGMDRGFFMFDPRQKPQAHAGPWQALISQVFCSGDSLLAGPWQRNGGLRVPHKLKDFRFRFGATDFSGGDGLRFRYRLAGLESGWSAWQAAAGKEYTNLPPGTYTFELQARNPDGLESEVAAFRFEIAPPWYASLGARIAYLLVLLLAAGGLILIPRRRFEKEKAEIVTLHQTQKAAQQQELARSQETIGHLMREKLESEIGHKTRELATATMHLVQKNEVLTHLREELEQVAARNPGHPGSAQLREIIRMLNHDQQFDADWEQFASHFDQVHEGFLRRIQERYPQLTPKDQRLCAYLRMNLATKEIAPLMNISVRGVEISRYRLRKKLGLDSEVNLNEFMMGF